MVVKCAMGLGRSVYVMNCQICSNEDKNWNDCEVGEMMNPDEIARILNESAASVRTREGSGGEGRTRPYAVIEEDPILMGLAKMQKVYVMNTPDFVGPVIAAWGSDVKQYTRTVDAEGKTSWRQKCTCYPKPSIEAAMAEVVQAVRMDNSSEVPGEIQKWYLLRSSTAFKGPAMLCMPLDFSSTCLTVRGDFKARTSARSFEAENWQECVRMWNKRIHDVLWYRKRAQIEEMRRSMSKNQPKLTMDQIQAQMELASREADDERVERDRTNEVLRQLAEDEFAKQQRQVSQSLREGDGSREDGVGPREESGSGKRASPIEGDRRSEEVGNKRAKLIIITKQPSETTVHIENGLTAEAGGPRVDFGFVQEEVASQSEVPVEEGGSEDAAKDATIPASANVGSETGVFDREELGNIGGSPPRSTNMWEQIWPQVMEGGRSAEESMSPTLTLEHSAEKLFGDDASNSVENELGKMVESDKSEMSIASTESGNGVSKSKPKFADRVRRRRGGAAVN